MGCGLWTLKPRMEGWVDIPAASFLTLPALGAVLLLLWGVDVFVCVCVCSLKGEGGGAGSG